MKKLLLILAMAALALPVSLQAQGYAKSTDGSSLVALKVYYTATNTVTTNLTRDAFRLSAVPGGQSILAWGGTSLAGTNSTMTNKVVVTLATSIGDSSTGPWYTNATIGFDGRAGSDGTFTLGETNLGGAQWVRIVKAVVTGTNYNAAGAPLTNTITLKLGQHRP